MNSPLQHVGDCFSSSHQRSLTNLKMREFDGNPLERPEWGEMFLSMIDSSPLTNDEKMGHLRSLVNFNAKRAIARLGFSGAMCQQAWKTLQRKFGQPNLIVSTHLAKIQTLPAISHHDSLALIEFVDSIAAFVRNLQQSGYSNDLFSSRNLDTAVGKFPTKIKRRWFAFVERLIRRHKLPNFMELNERLVNSSSVSGTSVFSDSNSTNRESNEKRVDAKKSKRPQGSFLNATKDSTKLSSKCPVDNQSHRTWNCEKCKTMSLDERYAAKKEINTFLLPRKKTLGKQGNKLAQRILKPVRTKPATLNQY